MVFDDTERTDDSPMGHREPDFVFYNRSACKTVANVRQLINECVLHYPREGVKELVARLRSGNNTHFRSAIFELFLHEALRRKGFKLIPHPELPDGNPYRPDFLVIDTNDDEFYLEAVLASENNGRDEAGEARKGVVFDTLSKHPHVNFMVDIDDEGSPRSPPRGRQLASIIHKWLDSLDPDEVLEEIEHRGFDEIKPLEWSHDGWSIQVRPIPLKPHRRGNSRSLVGVAGYGFSWVNAWSPIRDAVKGKGAKYGVLKKPLVVAVNLNSFHLDRFDEVQALFGQEQLVVNVNGSEEPRREREPNGLWLGVNGPQYTRVSAVWMFNDLYASSLATRNGTIYFNPWASNCAPHSLRGFSHASIYKDEIHWFDGLSFREVFELHEKWPIE